MRDCWVRDIADFFKYGMLRRLAGEDLQLGVVWYRTVRAEKKWPLVAYLARPSEYKACDEVLFSVLKLIDQECGANSTVRDVERTGVLPNGTTFYCEPIDAVHGHIPSLSREAWFAGALLATVEASLVFLDPDTGLLRPGQNVADGDQKQYATVEEIMEFQARGQSVAVIQFGAPGNAEPEPRIARAKLATLSAVAREHGRPAPWGLWWADTHKVGLLVAPHVDHTDILCRRRDEILADPAWGKRVQRL